MFAAIIMIFEIEPKPVIIIAIFDLLTSLLGI